MHEIFCGLHESLAGEVDDRDCTSHECLSHTIFGMKHLSIMKCYNCGLETEHLRMTCLFHSVDQDVLRVMKACFLLPEFFLETLIDKLLRSPRLEHVFLPDLISVGSDNAHE